MLERITHRAFFGDANYPFALSDGMLAELEQITGKGASAVYVQLANLTYTAATLREIIRLGLIGAGMSPKEAKRLVEAYAVNTPLGELFPLAFEILSVRWDGTGEKATAAEKDKPAERSWVQELADASGADRFAEARA
ncbi:gene transfer agent family protein [Pararhodobacter aggregans]